jgi:dihydropyrimidinase
MAEFDFVVRNAVIVNHDGRQAADIGIRNEAIAALGDRGSLSGRRELDASGLLAVPGLIDSHVHFGNCQPYESDMADTLAAAHGGITTIGNFIGIGYTHQTRNYLSTLPSWISTWESSAYADGFFHAIITSDDHLDSMEAYAREFGITSFKFMAYAGADAEQLRGLVPIDDGHRWEGFSNVAKLGSPAIAMGHAENISIVQRRRRHIQATGRNDLMAVTETRPRWVEAIELKKLLYLAEVTGARYYAVHLSAAESVTLLAEARSRGFPVFGETNPNYLTHTADESSLGALGVEWPPLKDKESQEALWRALHDGVVETLGTDHCPIVRADKPDVWSCEPGYAGLETLVPVILSEGVNKGRITLEKFVAILSYNPARIFGLKRKGRIAVGADADIVLIDLNAERVVEPNRLHYWHADFTLYDRWVLKGWPVSTILRGHEVVLNGRSVAGPGIGRYIARELEQSAVDERVAVEHQ